MFDKKFFLFILIIFLCIQGLYAQSVNIRNPENGDVFKPGDIVDIFCNPTSMSFADSGTFQLYVNGERKQYITWWEDMDFHYNLTLLENNPADSYTIRVDMSWTYNGIGTEYDSEEVTIYVDRYNPTVQITKPVPDLWYNDSVDITVRAQDDLAGIEKINIYKGNNQLITSKSLSGTYLEYNFSYHWSGENGSNTIYAVVYDNVGRSAESERIDFNIDQDTPNIYIDSPADLSLFKGNKMVEIQVRGTDAGTGIQNIDLFINGNIMTTFSSSPGTFSWLTPSVSGIYEIKATAFDYAGHSQSKTIYVTVDADTPELTGTPFVPGSIDGFTNNSSVCWEWPAATDPSQYLQGYTIFIVDDNASIVTITRTEDTSFTHEGANNRTYTCMVAAYDMAGNNSSLISGTITVDTVAADAIFSHYPFVYTNGDLTVTWEEGEDLSGIIRYEVNLMQELLPPLSGWIGQVTAPDPNTGQWTYTFSNVTLFSPSSVWIRSVDRAGNVSVEISPGTFPHFTLTMPDSGEVTNQPVRTFTFTEPLDANPDLFDWRIAFSKAGSEQYNTGLMAPGSFTYTFPSDGVWYEELEIFEYPDGSTIPAVTHRDTLTLTIDTVPPDVCSFIITSLEDTKTYSTSTPANTNLIHINDIDAADAPSEASSGLDFVHIYYGNGEDIPQERITIDSSNISDTNPVTWTLPETDGLHTMQMAAFDNAGNNTRFLYTIALDMTPPLPPVDISHTNEPGKTIFTWNAGDPGDSLIKYTCVYTLPGGTEQIFSVIPDAENKGRLEIAHDPAIINKLVSLEVTAVDRAENVSSGQIYTSYTQALPGTLQLIAGGYDPVTERMFNAWELTDTENAAGHVLEYGEISGAVFIPEGFITPDESFTFIHDDYAGLMLEPHGEYAYRLKAYNDGGDSFYGTPFTQIVPNNPPMTPVIISPAGYVRDSVTFVWEDSFDYDDDPLTYRIFYGQGESPIEYSEVLDGMTFEFEDSDVYSWYVQVDDGYEMIQSERVGFIIDATPPEINTVEIIFPYTNQENIAITVFDASQTVSSITCRMIDPETNLPISEEGIPLGLNGMGDMGAEIPLPEGYYHLFLMVEDSAGNTAQKQIFHLRVDHTPPAFEEIEAGLIEYDGTYCAPRGKIPVSFSGTDDFSGVRKLVYTIIDQMQNPLGGEMHISLPPGTDNYAYTLQGPETGITPYYMRFSLCDGAGNISEPLVRGPFITDTTPPDLSFTLDHTGLLYYGTHYYISSFSQLQKMTIAGDAETGIMDVTYALSNNATGEILVDWETWETMIQALPPEGIVCRLACKGENHAKMITVKQSVPFIIDTTPPENMSLTLSDSIFVPGEPCFITINADEPESTITEYLLSIGTTTGDISLSALIPGNRDGKIVVPATAGVARTHIIIPDCAENMYYITYDAINSAGLTASAAGPEFTLSTTAAKMIVFDNGPYSMFSDRLTGSWHYTGEESFLHYLFRIIDEDEQAISPWSETLETTRTVNDLSLENGKTYYFEARVLFTGGDYSGTVKSRGVTIDTIPPEVISLEVPSYATADNMYMNWEARDPESGIGAVYVAAGSEPGKSDISGGWIPVVLPSIYFSLDVDGNNLAMETGTWCYVTLRTVNGSGLFTE